MHRRQINNLNQYTAVGGTAHTYDDNGNLASDGLFRYYYDGENRLIDINDASDALVASYAYDYQGRRISRTVYGTPNVTIRYAYDGHQIIAEYDGAGTLLRKFVYGPGIDEPICLIDAADANALYYYHFDGLGSVAALCDVNSAPVERYAYDVFGRPTIRDGSGTVIAESAFANPYLFTGRAWDPETALYYYRARYYDYFTARFLQPDPTGYTDGLNLYSYVRNNPVNAIDPWGLSLLPPGYEWWFRVPDPRAWLPNLDWHRTRNQHNHAYATVQEMRRAAEDHPDWWEREEGNPFHWPDTYRGRGPYAGCQASYYPAPDDPWLREHPEAAQYYDSSKACLLDDETPFMGTWDYVPPYASWWGHGRYDVLPHYWDSVNYTPGLTTIESYP